MSNARKFVISITEKKSGFKDSMENLCFIIKFKMFFNTVIKFWNSYKNEQAVAVVIFLWSSDWRNSDGGVNILQKWGYERNEGLLEDEVDKHLHTMKCDLWKYVLYLIPKLLRL